MPHTEEAKRKMSLAHIGKPNFSRRREMKAVDGVEHWKCCNCQQFFPKEGFYKDSQTILGITSKCRKCHSKTVMATRDKENTRDKNKEYMRRARIKNPEKFRARERVFAKNRVKNEKTGARTILNNAVRDGKISKPDFCQQCGTKGRVTGHHHDYNKPLDVEWICYECHGKEHRQQPLVIEFKKLKT